jgi:hypothetical protein
MSQQLSSHGFGYPFRRYGLYFLLSLKNIQHPEVCAFLRDLLRHLRSHFSRIRRSQSRKRSMNPVLL